MKKVIVFLISCLLLTSCVNTNKNGALTTTDNFGTTLKLVEIEFNGETHEYVLFEATYEGSLSHWEGCKYCKEKSQQR